LPEKFNGAITSPVTSADFDYELPADRIAQAPTASRDESRLLIYHRSEDRLEHRRFSDLVEYLQRDDVLVLNNSKVVRARLRGRNAQTGGAFEMLLLEETSLNEWWAMLRPGRRARAHTRIQLLDRAGKPTAMTATVLESNEEGHRRLRFEGTLNIAAELETLGEMPVPPYIQRENAQEKELDDARYQTVYAQAPGSVAAPTAGLHFTSELLRELKLHGVEIAHVTLHVGLGTFAPVKVENLPAHRMHEERFFLGKETTQQIQRARAAGRRVVAVGTTTLRTLESVAAKNQGALVPENSRTNLFIYPPYHFRVVDALLTNFHLPRSTLLMLVSAFIAPDSAAGAKKILACYREAIERGYRFFSYGDAMLIL
jgi:S-adenosylmethionine:tRNA ribosyltransferase-isomerase